MKNFLNFINESKHVVFKYMLFDWDDNILHMDTQIHMKHKVGEEWIPTKVSTEEFAKIRNDKDNWTYDDEPFYEFRDYDKNIFFKNSIEAIENKQFGPSWKKFLDCLVSGTLFAIITARGHEPKTIRKVVEYIIYTVLTEDQQNEMAANLSGFKNLFDEEDFLVEQSFDKLLKDYLNNCDFIGVSSPSFMKKHPEIAGEHGASNPEKAKQLAAKDFIDKIMKYANKINAKFKLGFSDDDVRTLKSMGHYFNEIKGLYDIDFYTFDTSEKGLEGGKKAKIE